MVLVSSNLGLPDLQEDLGAHFAAVAALFLPDPSVSHSPPPLTPVPTFSRVDSLGVDSPIPQESPSASLPPFWQEHRNLHSFLLISLASFTEVLKDCPTFPHASLDSTYEVGIYVLRTTDLQLYKAPKWVTVVKFPNAEIPLITRSSKFVYFKLT